jgi:hypothetical protein
MAATLTAGLHRRRSKLHGSIPVIIAILAGSAGDAPRAACARLGYPHFDTMDGAVRALVALSDL